MPTIVNLLDKQGKESKERVGEGTPLPPASNPPADQMKPPSPSPSVAGGQPASGSGAVTAASTDAAADYGDHHQSASAAKDPQKSEARAVVSRPRHNRPTDVITYRPGNATIRYEDDRQHPSMKLEITEENGRRWISEFCVPPEIAARLKNPRSMILEWIDVPLQEGAPPITCHGGGLHSSVPIYIVLESDGQTYVAGMYPGGRYLKLDIPQLSMIGDRRSASEKLWDWLCGSQERRFTDGDLALIHAYAVATVNPNVGAPGALVRHRSTASGEDGAEQERGIRDAYLFRWMHKGTVAYTAIQSRAGAGWIIPPESPLHPILENFETPVTKALVEIWDEARTAGHLLVLLGVDGTSTILLYRGDGDSHGSLEVLAATGRRTFVSRTPEGVLLDSLFRRSPMPTRLHLELLRAGYLDPFLTHSFVDQPPGFVQEMCRMATADWQEVYMKFTDVSARSGQRVVFAKGVESNQWEIGFLEEVDGAIEKAVVPGARIEQRYADLATDLGLIGSAPKDLTTPANRRWFLDLLVRPESEWHNSLRANPVGLLKP